VGGRGFEAVEVSGAAERANVGEDDNVAADDAEVCEGRGTAVLAPLLNSGED
jgi:hypothetical protein